MFPFFIKHPALLVPLALTPGLLYAQVQDKPPLQLAAEYQQQDTRDYRVSEKLDGVRAYWNGRELLSRGGHRFSAPDWFVAGFPDTPLDGELWLGRGRFEELSAAVRRYRPDEDEWRAIRFMVFDLPASELPFEARLSAEVRDERLCVLIYEVVAWRPIVAIGIDICVISVHQNVGVRVLEGRWQEI